MSTSCVIVNYNSSVLTEKLIISISKYDSIDFIVIVDNCSRDNSYNQLDKYSSEKVRLIKSEKNGGYGYGNNIGIKYSKEVLNVDKVLICNPDVKFSNENVISMQNTMDRNDNCGIVSCIPYKNDGSLQANGFWNLTSPITYALRTSTLYNKVSKNVYKKPEIYDAKVREVEVDCVVGSLLLLDINLMLKYGMYDERVFLYCEETILGIKLKNANLRTIVLIKEKYLHDHDASSSVASVLNRRKIVVNSKRIVLKDYYKLKGLKLFFSKLILNYSVIEARLFFLVMKLLHLKKGKL